MSCTIISRTESIEGGRWGAEGGAKHPFGLKGQCCAFSKWHELIQSTREAQTAMRSSLVPHACNPINAPQDHEMHAPSWHRSYRLRTRYRVYMIYRKARKFRGRLIFVDFVCILNPRNLNIFFVAEIHEIF